jgi:fructan beta-fructosidase
MSAMKFICISMLLMASATTPAQTKSPTPHFSKEKYRPHFHFSPKTGWMNDPNGMIFYNGVYHLFFQYYPDSTVWGPMHWGHATSKDLMHWQEHPIALYPDSLGYIFSGSAVLDKANSSGLGKNGKAPLVAIFTHHDPVGAKEGKIDYQVQSLAYSNDNGKTWKKYAGNPVLKNPGIFDFRDPKVMWHEPTKKWIMTLAIKDHIGFYSSPDLKEWREESQFGKELGAHGGVWECPDLFSFDHNGKEIWVLIVNLNPGGPNGGSATQYFVGEFDGKHFTTRQTDTRWLDYGPDEYAGITWSNVGNRKIFFGWMSNWLYGQEVPTEKWRSAMTIPRDLCIKQVGSELFVASVPSPEVKKIQTRGTWWAGLRPEKPILLRSLANEYGTPCRIDLNLDQLAEFSLKFSNDKGEELVVGYNKNQNQYYIDRTKSGKLDFHKEFAAKHIAPRISTDMKSNMTLIVDVSSIELFADDGLTVMTSIFFPSTPYSQIFVQSNSGAIINRLAYSKLKSGQYVENSKTQISNNK